MSDKKREYEEIKDFLILMYDEDESVAYNIEYLQDVLRTSEYDVKDADIFDLVLESIKEDS